jgi:hypothetical protein
MPTPRRKAEKPKSEALAREGDIGTRLSVA